MICLYRNKVTYEAYFKKSKAILLFQEFSSQKCKKKKNQTKYTYAL